MIGCETLKPLSVSHESHQSNAPFSGASPTTRDAVTTTIWRRPASSTSIGETYACMSSSTRQTGAPLFLLYATTDLPEAPPGSTITLSSTIRGEAAIAHGRFLA